MERADGLIIYTLNAFGAVRQNFETVAQARVAFARYIEFYNMLRPHQALGYKTPEQAFKDWLDVDNDLPMGPITTIDKFANTQTRKPIVGGNMTFS